MCHWYSTAVLRISTIKSTYLGWLRQFPTVSIASSVIKVNKMLPNVMAKGMGAQPYR
jgi:hypothetical protein